MAEHRRGEGSRAVADKSVYPCPQDPCSILAEGISAPHQSPSSPSTPRRHAPQQAGGAAQLVTCSARVPRTRSRMLLCGPLDLAASQGAYALQPRVLRVRSAAAIPRTHGQPLRPLWRRFSISSPLGALSLRCGLPPNRVYTVYILVVIARAHVRLGGGNRSRPLPHCGCG